MRGGTCWLLAMQPSLAGVSQPALPYPARPHAVCRDFLVQAPGSAGIIDAVHAALRAGAMSVAPSAAWAEDPLAVGLPRLAACQASAAAMQVSLGGVLPTLLAWQLQSRIAASLVAEAQARHDSAVMQQVRGRAGGARSDAGRVAGAQGALHAEHRSSCALAHGRQRA